MAYIELNTFLKIKNIADSGGHAKHIIQSGMVRVNDEVESRVRRKLHAGDRVVVDNKEYIVEAEVCRMKEKNK
jgi:ribosome-associated protein